MKSKNNSKKGKEKGKRKEKFVSMPVINDHAAGIDVGSCSHFAAVGQNLSDVREFGVYESDLRECASWLKSHDITTVIKQMSRYICKIQKCLRLMNFRLDVVLNDVTGKRGQAIIKAILSGEHDPQNLASLADWRVRTSEELMRAHIVKLNKPHPPLWQNPKN